MSQDLWGQKIMFSMLMHFSFRENWLIASAIFRQKCLLRTNSLNVSLYTEERKQIWNCDCFVDHRDQFHNTKEGMPIVCYTSIFIIT